jgi:hypothetical protein
MKSSMSLDPPDEWWWYVANDNGGQPNPFQIQPVSYRLRWTSLRMRRRIPLTLEQVLNFLYRTTHRNGGIGWRRRNSVLPM